MFDIQIDVFTIRIISAITMLVIASTVDLWKREIHDSIWVAFGALAVILLFLQENFVEEISTLIISLFIIPLSLVLWRIGFFGGADSLALIVLSVLAPMITLSDNLITPFTTLTNAALLSVFLLFVNASRNCIALLRKENIFEGFEETSLKKFLAMFLGYKAKNPKFGFSIEKKINNHKKLDLTLHNADNTEFCTVTNSWITPGIPYMIFITGGFIVQLLFGDIIFNGLGILP